MLEGIKLEQERKQVKNTFIIFATINIITKLSFEKHKVFIQVSIFIVTVYSVGQFQEEGNLPGAVRSNTSLT